VNVSAREVTFENPTHDFPQRVNYRLENDGSLLASIEGLINGKKKTVQFAMRRERCEANGK